MELLIVVAFLVLLGAFAAYLAVAGAPAPLTAAGTWRELAASSGRASAEAGAAPVALEALRTEGPASVEALWAEIEGLRGEVSELRARIEAPGEAAGQAKRRPSRKAA